MKIKITFIASFLLISFGSCISHTLFLIPPTIFFLIFSILVLFRNLLKENRVSTINLFSLPSIFFTIYLVLSQFFIGSSFKDIFGVSLAPIYFPITLYFLSILEYDKYQIVIKRFIDISLFVFIIECVWRLLHPVYTSFNLQNGFFYMFKNEGLMYKETNALAIHLIVIIFFLFWWGSVTSTHFWFKKSLFILLLILTFSRAGYISLLIGILFYLYNRLNFRYKHFVLLTIFIFVIFFSTVLYFTLFKNDISLNSKFLIYKNFVIYLDKAGLSKFLIGVGIYNSIKFLGIYAHNIFLVYFIETGVIGFVLFFFQFINFIFCSNFKVMIVLIPFFIITMSSSTLFIPYLYIALAIIIHHHKLIILNEKF